MSLQPARADRQLPAGPGAAGGLFGGVSGLAGWAARTGYGIVKRVPGASAVERGLRQVERTALTELRKRMDQEAKTPALLVGRVPVPGGVPVITTHGDFVPLRAAAAALLERSLMQSVSQAKDDLYAAILVGLVPDEVRILAALEDGSPSAVVDVVERVGVGGGRYLLRHASSVGKAAGITLDDHVPVYLARLRELALVEFGDEAPALSDQYDILQTEPSVRAALQSGRRAKVVRRTVRISAFGVAFWNACDPSAWD